MKSACAGAGRLLAAAACLLALPALPALAIVDGQPTEHFAEVGRWSTGASGVQVAPSWVLTARHIAPDVGTEFRNGLGSSTVAARYYYADDPFPAHDLALLRLATPIGNPQRRQLAIWSENYSPGRLVPTDVTMVSGQNHPPRGYAFATLRQAIDRRSADGTGPQMMLQVNHLLCHGLAEDGPHVQGGDSGGALFLGHVQDGSTPLLGLASAQTRYRDGDRTRVASAFVQLAMYRDWIDRTMREDTADDQQVRWANANGAQASNIWASWGFGIGTAVLLALLGLSIAFWHRRRT